MCDDAKSNWKQERIWKGDYEPEVEKDLTGHASCRWSHKVQDAQKGRKIGCPLEKISAVSHKSKEGYLQVSKQGDIQSEEGIGGQVYDTSKRTSECTVV